MRSYGIMQGRLTASNGRGIQFFPFDNWEKEFTLCAEIGLDEIEWIFDYERYDENPLWTHDGAKAVKDIISSTGVRINAVCFDYFMRCPFYKQSNDAQMSVRHENLEYVKRIIDAMKTIDANLLEVPMVDDSSVKTDLEKSKVIDFLHDVLEIADQADLLVGCETDMPVGVFREFLDEVNHKRIRANYDSGNSSGLGYNHADELHSLGEYVANVHIKDRVLHGTTVELGTGSADFDMVFGSLKEIGYGGSIILQAARNEDGMEVKNIQSQLKFIRDYCAKYNLE